ncbi:TIGR02677 family protein [Cohnella silvisoli]|uniref:TIGR02677 family protein n=1 Tax=Cohnella silvisoli TaxID=2873699 RepID=A0ABV1KND7_9BACL|nr:TIGR02677 family protein [Cohnella silvisoli]MCD9020212.1 TIGR02677 family protein [Cohnella silvisoli]
MKGIPSLQSLRGVSELKYVNADNVIRYRAIMRFIYQEYQRLNYWLKPEEIYEGIMKWELFDQYLFEQLQVDLEQLVEWKNLTSRHDGGKSATVEEYLRKKFQYLLTPYSIEIERMLEELENVRGYGGSLEPTLFDTIANKLFEIRSNSINFEPGEALDLWNELFESFKRLHQTSVDYIASLHTSKAEELMVTDAFLVYKESLTDYLQNFVQTLQRRAYKIEGNLNRISENIRDLFFDAVIEDELRKPRLEDVPTREELIEVYLRGWGNLKSWFIENGDSPSELSRLERSTKDAIVRIVRCALRIQERKRSGISKRKDLNYLGNWFYKTNELNDAHRLAALTFGLFQTRHLQGEEIRETDRADISMWLEKPMLRPLRSRSRKKNDRQDIESIPDNTERRKTSMKQILEYHRGELYLLQDMVRRGSVTISELGYISSNIRLSLMQWISRCTSSNSSKFRTPEGIEVTLYRPGFGDIAVLNCEDGELEMPNYKLTFTIGNEGFAESAAAQQME